MALISMREVCWGISDTPLLENITLQIEKGERVGLLGRNGVGKSTLLKIINGSILPDSGDIWRQQDMTTAALEQDLPTGYDGAVFDIVAEGMGETGKALAGYNRIVKATESEATHGLAETRATLQLKLDAAAGWQLQKKIESVLSRCRLDPDNKFADLSAGMQRDRKSVV